MPTFTVDVYEVISTPRRYTIEADTLADAQEKALAGDTTAEETLRTGEVMDRQLLTD